MKKELSAGTDAHSSTTADNSTSASVASKPNVICCPVRVQRKRTKGWKMPPNTICVNRPSVWGNPYKVVGDMVYKFAGDRRKILDPWIFLEVCKSPEDALLRCLELYENWLLPYKHGSDISEYYHSLIRLDAIKTQLLGKNLACFCPLDKPCHADILLRLANG